MRKSVSTHWGRFDAALDMFEPEFNIERDQGIQEHREPLDAFVESKPSFAHSIRSKAAKDVKKPL